MDSQFLEKYNNLLAVYDNPDPEKRIFVSFRDNFKNPRTGRRVGTYFAVTYAYADVPNSYSVYYIKSGLKVVDVTFADADNPLKGLKAALRFAAFISVLYEPFLEIMSIMPTINILAFCRWESVKHLNLFCMVSAVINKGGSIDDILKKTMSDELLDEFKNIRTHWLRGQTYEKAMGLDPYGNKHIESVA